MSSSDNLKKICEENGILLKDIITSFNLMSGHINEYSLKDILQYAVESYDATKRLFEYEKKTRINDTMTLLDLLKKRQDIGIGYHI